MKSTPVCDPCKRPLRLLGQHTMAPEGERSIIPRLFEVDEPMSFDVWLCPACGKAALYWAGEGPWFEV